MKGYLLLPEWKARRFGRCRAMRRNGISPSGLEIFRPDTVSTFVARSYISPAILRVPPYFGTPASTCEIARRIWLRLNAGEWRPQGDDGHLPLAAMGTVVVAIESRWPRWTLNPASNGPTQPGTQFAAVPWRRDQRLAGVSLNCLGCTVTPICRSVPLSAASAWLAAAECATCRHPR